MSVSFVIMIKLSKRRPHNLILLNFQFLVNLPIAKKRLGLMAAIHRYLPFLFFVADIPTHQLSVAHPLTDRNISFGNTLELNDQMANS